MDNLQNQVNARVEAFVAEITGLARAAAYQALSAGLDTPIASGRGATVAMRGRKGGKRTADEIAQMADAFLAHVTANPGQRMEHIAKELGLATPELTLPDSMTADMTQLLGRRQCRFLPRYPEIRQRS